MLNVGLTGGIGAGKSEVTKRFAALGATVIDADALAREVVAIGTPGLDAVIAEFGEEMRGDDGGLDRDKMAALVFNDDEARQRLNGIVHPLVGERVFELLAQAERDDPDGILLNDVPLIVEAGVAERYEVIVVVDAPEDVQLDRLLNIRGMSEADARARMGKQASREDRRAIADYVIDNSGDLADLQRQVDEVWAALVERAHAKSAG
ncbi:MAG: dephospho-CoA kinase [Frankiaceae bacterium]|nr:dephospho-CoA kinase [Frankiaceae bacterium]MBV9870656.1 dephospho-CoA kinase [Frankiaceae bacterium]